MNSSREKKDHKYQLNRFKVLPPVYRSPTLDKGFQTASSF